MSKFSEWMSNIRKRLSMIYSLKNRDLTHARLLGFSKLLMINDVDANDPNTVRLETVSSSCTRLQVGDNRLGITIDIMTDSGNIYMMNTFKPINNMNGLNSQYLTYQGTFNGKIDVDHMERNTDARNINIEATEDMIDLICSCMLYTIKNYIKRWP